MAAKEETYAAAYNDPENDVEGSFGQHAHGQTHSHHDRHGNRQHNDSRQHADDFQRFAGRLMTVVVDQHRHKIHENWVCSILGWQGDISATRQPVSKDSLYRLVAADAVLGHNHLNTTLNFIV